MIGEGRFGKVFLGKNKITHKEVAIKHITLNNNQITQLVLRDIVISKSLDHDNIIKLHDVYIFSNSVKLVMDRLELSLNDYLKTKPVLSPIIIKVN